MNCEKFRNDILANVSKSLQKRRADRLEKHLENCRDCRNTSKTFDWVWEELGNISITTDKSMRNRISDRISDYLEPPTSVSKSVPVWVYAVAASLIFFIGFWIYIRDMGIPEKAAALHAQTTIPRQRIEKTEIKEMIKEKLQLEVDIPVPPDTSLLGGKICRLEDMVVAQIMYQYRGTPISLIIWNVQWVNAYQGIPKDIKHPLVFSKRGHSLIIWRDRNLLHCLVARLKPKKLGAIFGISLDHLGQSSSLLNNFRIK